VVLWSVELGLLSAHGLVLGVSLNPVADLIQVLRGAISAIKSGKLRGALTPDVHTE